MGEDAKIDLSGEDLLEFIKLSYPKIYARAYPRRYQHPDAYHSPKWLALLAADSYMQRKLDFKIDGKNINMPSMHSYRVLAELVDMGVPTYFVSPALLSALMNTKLPDMRLCDLKWPLAALLFVLPKGGLASPDGDCMYLGIASLPKEPNPPMLDEVGVVARTASICTVCYTSSKAAYTWSHPLNEDPVSIGASDPLMEYYRPIGNMIGNDGSVLGGIPELIPQDLPEAEKNFIAFAPQLAIQVMLAMVSRPDLVTSGSCIRGGKTSGKFKDSPKPEVWSPNVIGKTYTIKSERSDEDSGTGTHASPRTHWRVGHFRLYEPCPENRWKVSKQIWIEPVLVSARK
jgi:hypothetical protein